MSSSAGMDIRLPMGLMFFIIGAVIVVYGVATLGDAMYADHSMGININVWWGSVLMLFGLLMLALVAGSKAVRAEIGDSKMNQANSPQAHSVPSGKLGAVIGFLAGTLLGYPISYFFQPGALRAKLSMADYIQSIGDVLNSRNDGIAMTAIVTWVICPIVFAVLGVFVEKALGKRS